MELEPKSRPLSSQAFALSCNRQILTGEPPANKVNWLEISLSNFSDIAEPLHIGPVVGKHGLTFFVDLHLPGASQPRLLKAQVKTTYPGEQASKLHTVSIT
jgi:hypothetical protein